MQPGGLEINNVLRYEHHPQFPETAESLERGRQVLRVDLEHGARCYVQILAMNAGSEQRRSQYQYGSKHCRFQNPCQLCVAELRRIASGVSSTTTAKRRCKNLIILPGSSAGNMPLMWTLSRFGSSMFKRRVPVRLYSSTACSRGVESKVNTPRVQDVAAATSTFRAARGNCAPNLACSPADTMSGGASWFSARGAVAPTVTWPSMTVIEASSSLR